MAQATESTAAEHGSHAIPVSIGAMLVTLGVVYGDIGTSPMYVTKALLAGQGGIMTVTEEFILGALFARHLDGHAADHRQIRTRLQGRQSRRGRHLRPL